MTFVEILQEFLGPDPFGGVLYPIFSIIAVLVVLDGVFRFLFGTVSALFTGRR